MKTEPFDIEKAKAGRKVVTRGGSRVEIKIFDGRGEESLGGYLEDELFLSHWLPDGSWLDSNSANDKDLLLVSLEFPDPPAGHVWHNPLGLTPEQVGEEHRLALVGEKIEYGQLYSYMEPGFRKIKTGRGRGIVGEWAAEDVILLPKDAPFNNIAPAKPSLDQLIDLVKQWGIEKQITGPDGKATLLKQLEKTQEELIETRDAVVVMETVDLYTDQPAFDKYRREALDGYGDQLVTIILGLEMLNSSVPEALQMAYDVISKRTGKMLDGQFVKDA